jgi:hypothetical protein
VLSRSDSINSASALTPSTPALTSMDLHGVAISPVTSAYSRTQSMSAAGEAPVSPSDTILFTPASPPGRSRSSRTTGGTPAARSRSA